MADVTAPLYWKESPKGLRNCRFKPLRTARGDLGLSVFLLLTLGILISANLATLRSRFAGRSIPKTFSCRSGMCSKTCWRLESNMRAYALTADPRHISSWENLATDTRGAWPSWLSLVSDNPGQTQKLSMLRPKIEERLGRWARMRHRRTEQQTPQSRRICAMNLPGMSSAIRWGIGRRAVRLSRGGDAASAGTANCSRTANTLSPIFRSLIILAAPAFGAIGLVHAAA